MDGYGVNLRSSGMSINFLGIWVRIFGEILVISSNKANFMLSQSKGINFMNNYALSNIL